MAFCLVSPSVMGPANWLAADSMADRHRCQSCIGCRHDAPGRTMARGLGTRARGAGPTRPAPIIPSWGRPWEASVGRKAALRKSPKGSVLRNPRVDALLLGILSGAPEWWGLACEPLTQRRTLELLSVLGGKPGSLLDHPTYGPPFFAGLSDIVSATDTCAEHMAGAVADLEPYPLVSAHLAVGMWADTRTYIPAMGAENRYHLIRWAVLCLHQILGGAPSLVARLILLHGYFLALHREVVRRLAAQPAGSLLLDLEHDVLSTDELSRIAKRLRGLGRHDFSARDLSRGRNRIEDRKETDSVTLEAVAEYLARHSVQNRSQRLAQAIGGEYKHLPLHIKDRLRDEIRRAARQKRTAETVLFDDPTSGTMDRLRMHLGDLEVWKDDVPTRAVMPWKVLGDLSKCDQQVLVLWLQGYSHTKIAKRLSLGGESTVRYRVTLILDRLRQK